MRASKDFILREIAGKFVLVPVGVAAAEFSGRITMNQITHFIFLALQEEQTEESLVEKIDEKYALGAEAALWELRRFLQQLRDLGALIEDP